MNDLRKDILAALSANTEISRICGRNGVFPVKAPRGAARPHVLYWCNGIQPSVTHDQVNRDETSGPLLRKADRYEWVVAAIAEDVDVAGELFEAIYDALHARTMATSSLVLLFQTAEDQAEFKQDDSGDIVFQLASTYLALRRPS